MLKNKLLIKEKSSMIFLLVIFLFSFILDMYLLTRYNLSYGMDGPYYDLQVLNILQTGFPISSDPPLAYYILTPLVAITGNSFLGIKLGVAIIGSSLAIPAYFLTEIFNEKMSVNSKVPALLSAFLITVNVFYFQMIGDFLQNLIGVFFLLLLIYFTVKWLENTKKWQKYGTITIILLLCSILTHIYTGMVALVIFVSLIIFSMIFKAYKTRKIPFFDLKIFGILLIIIAGGLVTLFTVYPLMFSKFTTVISFFNGTAENSLNSSPMNSVNITILLTIPFLLGIFAAAKIFYKGLREKLSPEKSVINKKTLLSWTYLITALILIILSVVPSEYQNRFIMLSFVPVALLVPLGLQLVEKWFYNRFHDRNGLRIGLISIIAILFALSSFYTASESFSDMGPSISSEQYNALLEIKAANTTEKIDSNGIMVVSEYHAGYWVEYVLGMQVESGNVSDLKEEYPDKEIYQINLNLNESSASKGNSEYLWNPLLPYSFPWGIDLNLSSQQSNQAHGMGDEKPMDNDSNGPPDLPSGATTNTSNSLPSFPNGTSTNNMNQTFQLRDSGFNGSGSSVNMNNPEIMASGTLIFSWGDIKVYKL
jgi:hypothetical protein